MLQHGIFAWWRINSTAAATQFGLVGIRLLPSPRCTFTYAYDDFVPLHPFAHCSFPSSPYPFLMLRSRSDKLNISTLIGTSSTHSNIRCLFFCNIIRPLLSIEFFEIGKKLPWHKLVAIYRVEFDNETVMDGINE